jgi:hypothetical protein
MNPVLAVSWSGRLSEIFAGVAALGAVAVVVASAITIRYTRRTLEEARTADLEAQRAHRQELQARAEQLHAEVRHRRLQQTQRVVQLVTALAMISVEQAPDDAERLSRLTAVRLETAAALRLLTLLGGYELPHCNLLATSIGLPDAETLSAAQRELVDSLEAEIRQLQIEA